ncbi:MAG: tetraacyldisaccharide 4'-kinase [Gammaproteobacteria bacterium]|nr:tetraacyldisaccharide 4'-kinase [Gammaproteobacteria bacterium]
MKNPSGTDFRASREAAVVAAWYRGSRWLILLWPLAGLFWLLSTLRRALYRLGVFKTWRLPVPVIVVGNITLGGSGKTPVVLWLAEFLRNEGYRPGIVSRGYGGRAPEYPCLVTADSRPEAVGDEPLLLAMRSGVPVVVDPRRGRGAQHLVEALGCDLVIADDGLQHHALGRDIELVVIDGERRLGNNWLFPAGPLRESPSRLRRVDAVICNGGEARNGEWAMRLEASGWRSLPDGEAHELGSLTGRAVHALAGIGNPERFFTLLRGLGAKVLPHAFPDHHAYTATDLEFPGSELVLMTEKDAVKCRRFAGARPMGYVPVIARFETDFAARLRQLLASPRPR